MIIFFENGRLGNQLFQYCGLKKFFSKERLILIGFKELESACYDLDAKLVNSRIFNNKYFLYLIKALLLKLSNGYVLGKITEYHNNGSYSVKKRKGLIPGLFICWDVYFQDDEIFKNIKHVPELKSEWQVKAMDWFKSKAINTEAQTVFVHIRRGDYLKWPSKQYPAVLDLSWYKRVLKTCNSELSNPVFILMSDDLFYLRDIFNESVNLKISDNDHFTDLAIMSLCSHGVLSTSSYAWWGGYLAMRKRKQNLSDAKFYAPKYRAGHRAKKWHPPGLISDWLTYIDPNHE